MSILLLFTYLGLSSFMLSGALVAIKHNMDLGGIVFLTAITGLGGGTIRDVLLQRPVFWMQHDGYIYFAIIISLITFCFYHSLKKYTSRPIFEKTLDLFDVLGTVSFMIMSISTAQLQHQTVLTSVVLSVITCIGGGVLRDIICGKIPTVFTHELYATSVVMGSVVYIVIGYFNTVWATILACLLLMSLKIATMYFNLQLPKRSL